ncbi:hypothetical protein HJ526_15725 [Donghicola sp. C2-DW-16]|uniref:5-carboxymethyl-2-hydroxymuconate isomerase n=1 Tax=Donghicola mangrovi TaxID=2729614 RepID=A0A850QFK4_9RHOB|nr:hypothetical protein [Donghicola mangrovi]NVO24631.1 hypothetical protein [Donghicola mangrovi]NVO28879.1 hypothetical protein [Donghicola mangrovi]
MPHADLYYSADQTLPVKEVLQQIEKTIHDFDPSSGACKGRAHPIAEFNHSHIYLRLAMLPKEHRDSAFAKELATRLSQVLVPHATAPCGVNVNILFELVNYTSVTV